MLKNIFGSVILVLFLFISAFAAVNINSADEAALESVNGIGRAKAAAIIKYRKDHGPFKTLNELLKVKGIGPNVLNKIKGQVEIPE